MNYSTEYQNYMDNLYNRIREEINNESDSSSSSDNFDSSSSDSDSSDDIGSNSVYAYLRNNNMNVQQPNFRHTRRMSISNTPNRIPSEEEISQIYQNRNIYDDYGKTTQNGDKNLDKIKKLLKFEENKFIIKLPEPTKTCPVTLEEMREGYKTICEHHLSYDGLFGWIKEGKIPAINLN